MNKNKLCLLCDRNKTYCDIIGLFCENQPVKFEELKINENKNTDQEFYFNGIARIDSISVYDFEKDLISEDLYSIDYIDSKLILKNKTKTNIFISYDKLVKKEEKKKLGVEFWMKWNGIYNMSPFSFNNYGIIFYKEYFGFNTNNKDVYGISSLGLENKWLHVFLEFNNDDITKNKIYINGKEQLLMQRTGCPNVKNLKATDNARISGYKLNNLYKFDGLIDEFRIWDLTDLTFTSREIKKNMYRVLDENIEYYNNLLAYYRFDNVDEKIKDYSKNKRNVYVVGGLFSEETQILNGYNTNQYITFVNPIKEINKKENYEFNYIINPADPRYEEKSMQMDDNGMEDDTKFFIHEIDKNNWSKIIDLRVW